MSLRHVHLSPAPLTLALALALGGGGPAWSAEAHAAAADGHAKPAAAPAKSGAGHGSADAATHGAHDAPAKAPAARAAAPKAAPVDNLERLRERLAEKLGATKPPEAPHNNIVRVAAKSSDTTHGAAPTVHAVAAPRKPSPQVLAAVEAHRAEKAALAGQDLPDGHGAAPVAAAGHGGSAHWTYNGETGPQAWGGLKPEFTTCAKGKRQSPIDIRGGIAVNLQPVAFDYRASGFRVVDNGHTVQVNIGSGNSIEVGGRRYELVQFHFHRPSEERIDGRQYDMDVHLVHKDPEGRLAVVAVLLERGAAQPVVQTVWNNLPLEKNEEALGSTVIDLNHLLPPDRGYFTYMGSLTTPPCSEGVLWMVMRQPVTLSQSQLDIFSRLYPMNARPVQSASGRLIKQSQ